MGPYTVASLTTVTCHNSKDSKPASFASAIPGQWRLGAAVLGCSRAVGRLELDRWSHWQGR